MNNFTEFELSTILKGWKETNSDYRSKKNMIKNIRVCAYLRKSQEDIKDNSLRLQRNEIDKFIKSINYIHKDEFNFYYNECDIFQEDNVSGMQGRARPEFNRMLKIIEENVGYYGVCLVYKLDRFSRKLEDTLNFITLLSKKYCVLKALDFEDNGDPTSNLLRGMLGMVAQYHAQNSALTSIKGTLKKVEEHKAVGLLPLGLIQEKILSKDFNHKGASNIVIDEDKAPIIREIFNKFVGGMPISEIEKYLKSNGYTNNANRYLTRQNIKYILKNKRYNGIYVYAEEKKRIRKYDNGVKKPDYYECKNAFPKIIDDELFQKAQILLEEKKESIHTFEGSSYLLTNCAICEYCKHPLHGWSRPKYNGKKYFDYVCTIHKKDKNECPTKRINKNYLEKVVLDTIKKLIYSIKLYMIANIDMIINDSRDTYKNKLTNLNNEISKNKIKINLLLDKLLNNQSHINLFEEKINELELKIDKLERDRKELNNFLNKKEDELRDVIKMMDKCDFVYDLSFIKILVNLIIDQVSVSNEFVKIKIKKLI